LISEVAGKKYITPTDEQRAALKAQHGRTGEVLFDGKMFIFQQPNRSHGKFWRAVSGQANADPAPIDQLGLQLVVAVGDLVATSLQDREPVRNALSAFLETRPMALDNPHFGPVFSELLGLAEEGSAEAAGKGCVVSKSIPGTSSTL
jgi:hypothetical protein